MITINAKTKEVRNAREHEPQMYSEWFPEYNTTPGYIRGWTKPNYPVPAIPVSIEYYSADATGPASIYVFTLNNMDCVQAWDQE